MALLLIDWINDLDFDGGDRLLPQALPAAKASAALRQRAKRAGVPVIYCNDNFGKWRSDFRSLLGHVLGGDVRGKPIAELLKPDDDDYFVLKPKHSGFFSTPLDILLRYLGVDTLVLAGFAADICILITANDAYMRDYRVIVPRDCVASNTRAKTEFTLKEVREVLNGSTPRSASVRLVAPSRRPGPDGRNPRGAGRVVG